MFTLKNDYYYELIITNEKNTISLNMNIKKTKVGIAINGINEIHENKQT